MENIKRPFEIIQRILQAHCQSHTSQRYNQSFVKELVKPTHNGQTIGTKKEHRSDNITYTQAGVLCFVGQESSKFIVQFFVGSSVVKALPAYSCKPLLASYSPVR